MNANQQRLTWGVTFATALFTAAWAIADPLPGRDRIKFSQKPMIATTMIDAQGIPAVYHGHDELSTAYGFGNAATPPAIYQGRFMADDFADKVNDPVLHVKWWGSYLDNFINPNMPVNKFLIAFEPDVPANQNPLGFSYPGVPAFTQVVNRGPLAPGSGTFTEKSILAVPGSEDIYEYNAELHLGKEFFQHPDTVYWLKIVAMVDAPLNQTFDPYNPPANVTRWGWHNRDYTQNNPYASMPPNVAPGENNQGPFLGNPDIWHFQDDAVTGDVRITPSQMGGFLMPDVFQPLPNMSPTNYVNGLDGPIVPGTTIGISQFSKDLAFELYTVVPEPATWLTLTIAMVGLLVAGRRRASND